MRLVCGIVLCGLMSSGLAASNAASFADFDSRATAGEKLNVVFFGGSLTWSANASEPNVTGFRGLMAKYLTERYPKARFAFFDAALGGTGSNLGIFRLERDVLSKKPDLVFLDFACNDGGGDTALAPTCCYEYLLREMIGRGVCVQQMFFTFRFWTKVGADPHKANPRRDVYWQLARAYGTPVGDVYETSLWKKMQAGEQSIDAVWPIDGGHPDDIGYRMFADAGIAGFEKGVREGAVCRVPSSPVFGTVRDLRRRDPAEGPLPQGWTRKLTYRTSLWYDGLSSRWMGDVAAFSGKVRSPLAVEASGNLFGVFGEADEHALTADVLADGRKIASFDGYHRAGPGRLFIWRVKLLDDWKDGASRRHSFAVDPIPSDDGKGEFHIGSVCTATVVPSTRAGASDVTSGDALEKLDHARGDSSVRADGVPMPFVAQCRGRVPLVVNADNDHYFKAWNMKGFLPLDERLSEAGARKYIDIITQGGRVTHLFACAIGQRADYDSKACDPIWLAVDEAKARGEEPNEWPVNARRLHDRGVDLFKVWCAYGREKGLAVWISQRMNDVHHVDAPRNMRTNRFWYEHPELHRSYGADRRHLTGFWTDEALNYAFPEVREFAFGIFRELVDRYDADGFELDFMRFWQHLTPGREREEAPVLTAFIRRCRDYANAKAKERGHPILVSTRVPSSHAAALAFGFDPETWARQGLVDLIVIANFWAAADYDFDFAGWKRRLASANPQVAVLPCAGDNIASGVSSVVPTNLEALRGWANNAYAEGADGIYLFNVAYLGDALQREVYSGTGFSPSSVAVAPRRYVVSYHDCTPKGVADGIQLPLDLAKGGALTVRVGSVAFTDRVRVLLGFSDGLSAPPSVLLNGMKMTVARPVGHPGRFGGAKSSWTWDAPPAALKTGNNVLTLLPSAADGRVIWAEIGVDWNP